VAPRPGAAAQARSCHAQKMSMRPGSVTVTSYLPGYRSASSSSSSLLGASSRA
jgi:hypothetical protein